MSLPCGDGSVHIGPITSFVQEVSRGAPMPIKATSCRMKSYKELHASVVVSTCKWFVGNLHTHQNKTWRRLYQDRTIIPNAKLASTSRLAYSWTLAMPTNHWWVVTVQIILLKCSCSNLLDIQFLSLYTCIGTSQHANLLWYCGQQSLSSCMRLHCATHAAFQWRRANRVHDFPSCANRSNHVPPWISHLHIWRRVDGFSGSVCTAGKKMALFNIKPCIIAHTHAGTIFFRNHFMLGNNVGVFEGVYY